MKTGVLASSQTRGSSRTLGASSMWGWRATRWGGGDSSTRITAAQYASWCLSSRAAGNPEHDRGELVTLQHWEAQMRQRGARATIRSRSRWAYAEKEHCGGVRESNDPRLER